jgi:N-acetylneuraminic acid mutarotase
MPVAVVPLATARLHGGQILVMGNTCDYFDYFHRSRPCTVATELYDPATNSWMRQGNMITTRVAPFPAAVLKDGRVLVAGGPVWNTRPDPLPWLPVSYSEMYDPAKGSWRAVASLYHARFDQVDAVLANGHVLVAGGFDGTAIVRSTEQYDPRTDRWSASAPMRRRRWRASAVTLAHGVVLVVGGWATISSTTRVRDLEEYMPGR